MKKSAISVDPDQTAPQEQSDLDLHYLQKKTFIFSMFKERLESNFCVPK